MEALLFELAFNEDRAHFTVNGHPFSIPKNLFDGAFITDKVEGFKDIHEYTIDAEIDPAEFIGQLIPYILYSKLNYDCDGLMISPALSMFIDKYLVDRYLLLEWIIEYYGAKLYKLREGDCGMYNIIGDVIIFIKSLYMGYLRYGEQETDCVVNIIVDDFTKLYDRLSTIFTEDFKSNHTNFDLKGDTAKFKFLVTREFIGDEEFFVPRFIETFFKHHEVTIEHDIPNIDVHDTPNRYVEKCKKKSKDEEVEKIMFCKFDSPKKIVVKKSKKKANVEDEE